MTVCKKCGKEASQNDLVCEYCGEPLGRTMNYEQEQYKKKVKVSFYEKTWLLWVSLFFLPPLGIFLLWKYGQYKNSTKIILTIVFLIYMFAAYSGGGA